MIKNYLTAIVIALFCLSGIKAQTIYSVPAPLQENSKDIKVYFDATGTALENQPATAKIYAHTGVYTNLSPNQWKYTTNWGQNEDKYLLTNQGGKLWMLYIGNIREYYNITNASEQVTSLNFVFRAAGNSPQSEDLFLKVYDEGLQLLLTSDANGQIIDGDTGYVTFTVNTTEPSDISLDVNGTVVATAQNAQQLVKAYTFTEPGDYKVTASASANGETVTQSLNFAYLTPALQVDYPGGTPQMGPVENPDGSVTFCIGAPQKKNIVLVGSWNDYAFTQSQNMYYQDTEDGRYFWTTVEGLDPDEMYIYYFVVDGGEYIVGDPYARLVLDPYNDKYLDTNVFPGLPEYPVDALNSQNVPVAVYQGSINNYNWVVDEFKAPQPENLIIYELLFRDFTGTEGQAKGNGTVRQAIEKLPYLLELGVNAIELLPIMEFNGNNSWGYNPNFYFAVDKAYGTPDDYKEFIDLCHQNGIAVILDMVFNQSDGMHPWYQMYQWKSNPFYNSSYEGNNGAPHAYSVLNDWNQGVPMVQQQFDDVIKYWMTEYKFDGFRFDLVKGLGLNDSYADASDAATNAYNASRVERMKHFKEVIASINPNGYCINENLAGAKEENEMADSGELNWANVNDAACQFAMGYPENSNMNRLYAPKDARNWGSTVSYLESHDEQRLAYKQDQWGVSGIKGNAKTSMQRIGSAAAQMILAPGAHMIWQFSEMGNAQNTKDNNGGNNTSPKIVNWALLDEPNHYGLYRSYCELIDIRNLNPQLFAQDVAFTMNCGQNNWNNGRFLSSVSDTQELYTAINPNVTGNITMTVPFKLKDNTAYEIISYSYDSTPSFDAVAGTITVPANCYVVVGTKNIEAVVESISADALNSLRIHVENSQIIIDYAENEVAVYSLDGRMVGSVNNNGTIYVAPGIYIVKSGRYSQKVLVK